MTGVLDYARQQYGLGSGDLIAFFTDPDRATNLFVRMAKASAIGAAGARTGFGTVDRSMAERLMDTGVSADAAAGGFAQATSLRELETPVGGDESVTRTDITGAIFDQNDAAKQRVEHAQDVRKARFQAGGGYAESREGVAGLGSANTR